MRTVKIAYPLLLLALALPATASAQAAPPDERAAARALAAAADRLSAAADDAGMAIDWIEDCRALDRVPPRRHAEAALVFLTGLFAREFFGRLAPVVQRARGEIADVRTADPVLISGRAAVRQTLRAIAAVPAPEPHPCAAYRAFARAGYPSGPVREASGWYELISSRGRSRKIAAAADRMVELGVPRKATRAFRELGE